MAIFALPFLLFLTHIHTFRPDCKKKAYVRLAPDYDALDVANKVGKPTLHSPYFTTCCHHISPLPFSPCRSVSYELCIVTCTNVSVTVYCFESFIKKMHCREKSLIKSQQMLVYQRCRTDTHSLAVQHCFWGAKGLHDDST